MSIENKIKKNITEEYNQFLYSEDFLKPVEQKTIIQYIDKFYNTQEKEAFDVIKDCINDD